MKNNKGYFFVTYSHEDEQGLESIVISVHPSEWLNNENNEILLERKQRCEDGEKLRDELRAEYDNESFWQKLKNPLSKEGRKYEIESAAEAPWEIEQELPLIKIINWKKISKQEFEDFSDMGQDIKE